MGIGTPEGMRGGAGTAAEVVAGGRSGPTLCGESEGSRRLGESSPRLPGLTKPPMKAGMRPIPICAAFMFMSGSTTEEGMPWAL